MSRFIYATDVYTNGFEITFSSYSNEWKARKIIQLYPIMVDLIDEQSNYTRLVSSNFQLIMQSNDIENKKIRMQKNWWEIGCIGTGIAVIILIVRGLK